ncbi:MAG: hypothetical protein LBR58_00170 [Propionibacteriaceae bacterium]|jgi:DNA-directed RNA polymerase subunit RPC12/RpoP|nr:hypothetical protein [Propionibacteriaceae bacterium]
MASKAHRVFHTEDERRHAAAGPLAERFMANLAEFYRGGDLDLANVTQLLWSRLTLSRRRLARMGLNLEWAFAEGMNPENTWYFQEHWSDDGKHTFVDADTYVKARRTYSRGGKQLRRIRFTGAAHCELIQSIRDDAVYLCPNCGAQSSLDGLLDGCDYCETRFNVDDFNLKVSSFSLRADPEGFADKVGSGANRWVTNLQKGKFPFKVSRVFFATWALAAVAFFFFPIIDDAYRYGTLVYVLASASAGLAMACVLLIFLFFIRLLGPPLIAYLAAVVMLLVMIFRMPLQWNAQGRARRSRKKFERTARQHDPLFSQGAFTSNAENKLLSIIYAETAADIEAIADVDAAPLREHYADVCDVNLRELNFKDFQLDGQLQRLVVEARLDLVRLRGNRIAKSRERATIALAKSKDALTQAACEAVLLRCGGCGSSLSLLDGGACGYCGRRLELWRLDWVVTDFAIR